MSEIAHAVNKNKSFLHWLLNINTSVRIDLK